MVCDVISAVTGFMVRVLHSQIQLGFTMLLGMEARPYF
jgi:hypothetical protein